MTPKPLHSASRSSPTRSTAVGSIRPNASRRSAGDASAPGRDSIPADLEDVNIGAVLYDRRRREWYLVSGIDDAGVSLRQADERYHVPHSLFVPWYGSRLFPVAETTSIGRPDWCSDNDVVTNADEGSDPATSDD